jgi:hypothetical protein
MKLEKDEIRECLRYSEYNSKYQERAPSKFKNFIPVSIGAVVLLAEDVVEVTLV